MGWGVNRQKTVCALARQELSRVDRLAAPAHFEMQLRRVNAAALADPRDHLPARDHIAALYPGATRDNVLVTTGCAEANFLVAWKFLTPGDEVVFQQPSYMQLAGWAEGLGAEVCRL